LFRPIQQQKSTGFYFTHAAYWAAGYNTTKQKKHRPHLGTVFITHQTTQLIQTNTANYSTGLKPGYQALTTQKNGTTSQAGANLYSFNQEYLCEKRISGYNQAKDT
jgi:hypothetical protein